MTGSVVVSVASRLTGWCPNTITGRSARAPSSSSQSSCSADSSPLMRSSREVSTNAIVTPGNVLQPTTLTFNVPAVAAGEYVVRLRVGGIDSLPVTLTGSPAALNFDPQQRIKVA